MKIKSAYTNLELDFDTMEKPMPNSDEKMILIKHDSLRDVVYNQLKLTETGTVSYNYIKADIEHAVVECVIDDGKGRVVTEIGEAVQSTLENDVARAYPVLIASQRAFDRAAILLLMLAGKQLSSGEMGEFIPVDFEAAILNPEFEEQPALDDNAEDEPYMPAPIVDETPTMDIPVGISDMVDEPIEEETPADIVDTASRLGELGIRPFAVGKYANLVNKTTGNKFTLAEVYNTDPDFLRRLLKIPTPQGALADEIPYIKEYVELIGNK